MSCSDPCLRLVLQGVTRAFILEGIDVAGRTLGGDAAQVLQQENFDYVNRWNAELGRHEVSRLSLSTAEQPKLHRQPCSEPSPRHSRRLTSVPTKTSRSRSRAQRASRRSSSKRESKSRTFARVEPVPSRPPPDIRLPPGSSTSKSLTSTPMQRRRRSSTWRASGSSSTGPTRRARITSTWSKSPVCGSRRRPRALPRCSVSRSSPRRRRTTTVSRLWKSGKKCGGLGTA